MDAPRHPWITERPGPIYIMTFPARATDEDVRAFATAREAWATTCEAPHAWVADLTALGWTSAPQRKIFAEHLKRFEPFDVRWNAGTGLVVPSALVRGFATAVFWLAPPKFPNEAFETRDQALAFCRRQLELRKAA